MRCKHHPKRSKHVINSTFTVHIQDCRFFSLITSFNIGHSRLSRVLWINFESLKCQRRFNDLKDFRKLLLNIQLFEFDLQGMEAQQSTLVSLLYLHSRFNCRFSYTGTWELVNLPVRTRNFSYHICYENIDRKHNKILQVKRQTDHGQTELRNMLVRKNVLNEINKKGTFTQGLQENQKKSISKFRRPLKLADKVNC